jgi:hypothetical protein
MDSAEDQLPRYYSGNYQGNNSSNHLSPLRDLFQNQGRIMGNLSKKLGSNDKKLEKLLIIKWKVFLLPSRTNIALTKC